MTTYRSLRMRSTVVLAIATLALAACSSDSVTGPTTNQNAQLILRFDSLHNATADESRSSAMLDIAQILAEGAPVATGTVMVNGVAEQYHMTAELQVLDEQGAPVDSQYSVAAWKGDGTDSIVVFNASAGFVAVLVGTPAGSGEFIGQGAPTLTLGAPGAACVSFLSVTPPDVSAPTPVTCQRQSTTVAFDAESVVGSTFALPSQSVAGIRLEVEIQPPAP
ncbi:MAG TPA: hypothetical protein VFW04_16735 [Gemmatimonadaceae bacterium]|nr:hypothetical protein [Gemmatimonadaceae bacterium]